MTSRWKNRIIVGGAVGMPLLIAVWLLTPANTAVPSTYVFLTTLVIAIALVGLITWDNGLATDSMAQVIHDVDVTPSTGPDVSNPADGTSTSTSRWNAWQSRGDALAATGRMRALLGLSGTLTSALLLYSWLR
jgi:hypothetical protein